MKKQITHFIVIYTLLLACVGWLVFSFIIQPPSPEQIFRDHLRTVVEVRAFNDESVKAFGSAVAINSDGLFITNAHVISIRQDQVFETIQIRFATDEDFIDATFYRKDRDIDLALIKVDAININIRPAIIRTGTLNEGETVFAIGNGQNYGISIKNGIISQRELIVVADGRTITAIQCALNITSGNSGGALLDSRGRLIGITTFRLRDQAGQTIFGTSFAIPIRIMQGFLNS